MLRRARAVSSILAWATVSFYVYLCLFLGSEGHPLVHMFIFLDLEAPQCSEPHLDAIAQYVLHILWYGDYHQTSRPLGEEGLWYFAALPRPTFSITSCPHSMGEANPRLMWVSSLEVGLWGCQFGKIWCQLKRGWRASTYKFCWIELDWVKIFKKF